MKRPAAFIGLALGALLVYLLAWPVRIEPIAWQAPPAPAYSGDHAVNQELAGLQRLDLAGEHGPEHVVLDKAGRVYAATLSGAILRWPADLSKAEVYVQSGGRPLGLDFDSEGRLLIADAYLGLLRVSADGRIETLADEIDGKKIGYADGVVAARDGWIYFSNASRRFPARENGGTFEASIYDVLEHSCSGELLAWNPASGKAERMLSGLCFANGVALSADETTLLVADTGAYRVWALPRTVRAAQLAEAAERGQIRPILENLPGFPDNLTRAPDGAFWLGLAKPRSKVADAMSNSPLLRKMTLRLPRAFWPVPPAYGHVLKFDLNGKILNDLQDPSGAYPETTGVTEAGGRLFIHSLHADWLGWRAAP